MGDIMDKREQIIYDLNGTCKSLHQALIEHDAEELEDNEDFLTYLDSQIFMCETCNWWSDLSEVAPSDNGELICNDCWEEE